MVKKKKFQEIPQIYLDTNIIRRMMEGKPRIANLINIMRTAKERKWGCFTSTYGMTELSDLRKDDIYLRKTVGEGLGYKEIIRGRDRKKLNPEELKDVKTYLDKFTKKHKEFVSYQIETETWQDAFTLATTSNLHSSDALHLASAIRFGAHILITDDEFFIEEATRLIELYRLEMKVVQPENVFDALAELGFNLDE